MRKYAYLKAPLERGDGNRICKIMLYETEEGVYLFEYGSPDAVQCSSDRLYDSTEDLFEDWNGLIDERGWIDIGDPLPDCQHDAFLPIRVKGRNIGKPEWGKFEILTDGKWEEYGSIMETSDIADSIRDLYLKHHKDRTLAHAEEVAKTAVRLAEKHHLDPEKAKTAALLHDISAVMSPREMQLMAAERGLPIDPAEEKHPFLLHQRISRIIAEERFAVKDADILSAVGCHTTLKRNAGPYDKLIFIADKISWDQEGAPPYGEKLKSLAAGSLDEACLFYIRYQFENHLLLMPHRWIAEARADLQERLRRAGKDAEGDTHPPSETGTLG